MIHLDGAEYGTADELAAVLGPDVTPDMIRNWARRDGLRQHRIPGPGHGTVLFPLCQAAQIERAKRLSTRGRPRRLDTEMSSSA